MKEFKQQIVEICNSFLENKINSLNSIIYEISESSNSESKSSAGDKHETSKAMMQLEIEKLGNQLKEAEFQLVEFNKIDFFKAYSFISLGSLVETNRGLFLIASSIGKISVNDKNIFVISSKSPLATAMIGKKINDAFSFNQIDYTIINLI
jgi:hypothetical protein